MGMVLSSRLVVDRRMGVCTYGQKDIISLSSVKLLVQRFRELD